MARRRSHSRGMEELLEAENVQEINLPLKPVGGTELCLPLDFRLWTSETDRE